jgi:hypothetical protein
MRWMAIAGGRAELDEITRAGALAFLHDIGKEYRGFREGPQFGDLAPLAAFDGAQVAA